jgi:hypothetical protein
MESWSQALLLQEPFLLSFLLMERGNVTAGGVEECDGWASTWMAWLESLLNE